MTEDLNADTLQKVKKGVSVLQSGGLVAYPTDTVYGLGASCDNIQAVEKIYKVKNRPVDTPLPLLLADVSWIEKITAFVSDTALLLIEAFMPGALTLVMSKNDSIPDIVCGGKQTVAVRIPAHPVALALIEGLASPLIGTSANLSGKENALTAEEVRNQLGDKVDFILDGGKCPGGKESTILDVTGDIPVLLREGAIARAEIEKVCRIITPGEEKE